MKQEHIRNFCIVAHVDHGKSTLADRILEKTGALQSREMREQFLDKMDLERERGITIKAQAVRLLYRSKSGQEYLFNLIDTPGHVDFNYEVSRSLSACEGALLVVDAVQGVEAQTVANAYLAINNDLEIVPVINKMDLAAADPERVKKEIEEQIGIPADHAIACSAKTGLGVEEILEAVIRYLPPPKGDSGAPLRALIFDSWFDSYLGVIVLVRVVDGEIRKGVKVRIVSTGKEYEVMTIGVFTPHAREMNVLGPGEVGFITAAIKSVHDTKIGDTIAAAASVNVAPLPGFKEVKPMVFAGFYPVDSGQYGALKDAMDKLRLNDSSFVFSPESSKALGFGFRCGFLGLLHLEIIRERLEREYQLELITTAPTVVFRVKTTQGEWIQVDSPQKLPPDNHILEIEEPFIKAQIHIPTSFLGAVIQLCTARRGVQTKMDYVTPERIHLGYELPLSEIMFDFFDRLKTVTQGYASFDYDFLDWRASDLIRLNIMINGDVVDALSVIVHREKAESIGRSIISKLRSEIPRQMYEVAIQAAIGSRIVARETVKALRKNVTAKCYGGDITRKRKLLEKQKEGKKRMKQVGNVTIPQEAFLAVLKVD